MTLSNDTVTTNNKTLRTAAIVAGVAYLFALLQGFALGFPASSVLFVSGNAAATNTSIAAHELLYRITILNELVMYASVIVLAVALYVILRTVNRSLSLLGLAFRLTEAIVSVVSLIASLAVLELLNGNSPAFPTDQLQAFVQTCLNLHTVGGRIGLVFTGLGSIVFYSLFFKSAYIPRALSGLGIAAYALMLAAVLVDMLTPGASARPLAVSILEFAPVILFETVVGLWLVIKGVRVQQPA